MISNSTRQIAKNLVVDHVSDDPLRALVDACISSVAVLDESGKILYSSKVWRLFQQGAVPETEHFEVAPRYFENCRRLAESDFEDDAGVTLADDLREILLVVKENFIINITAHRSIEDGPS